MVELGAPKQQLHDLYAHCLLDQPQCYRTATAMTRCAPDAGVAVQFRDVELQAVACQVLDRLASPAHALLGVQVKLVALPLCGRTSLLDRFR